MTEQTILKPCNCETGFCNNLPNPFVGYVCCQDATVIREEFNKALAAIETLEAERDGLREAIKNCAHGPCPTLATLALGELMG